MPSAPSAASGAPTSLKRAGSVPGTGTKAGSECSLWEGEWGRRTLLVPEHSRTPSKSSVFTCFGKFLKPEGTDYRELALIWLR